MSLGVVDHMTCTETKLHDDCEASSDLQTMRFHNMHAVVARRMGKKRSRTHMMSIRGHGKWQSTRG